MNRFLLAIILVPSMILFSSQQSVAQRKLLVLGSSTSSCVWGVTVPDSCYLYRLQKYYADRGAPVQVADRAVAGQQVYEGMPTTYTPPPGRRSPNPGLNITDGLREENPDVVLINYPSNGYDFMSVSEVMFCLRTIKQVANAAGKPCFITTSQPRYDNLTFNTSAVKKTLAAIKDSVLAEFGSFALNFWDGIVNNADTTILPQYDSDGTHPNNAGHAVLLQTVLNANIFNVVLPVKLVNFFSKPLMNGNSIEWNVEAEKEIKSYQLEKSIDGRTFSKIYEVAATNESKAHGYSYNDPSNLGAFYRLGIAGTDNFLKYTQTIEVNASGRNAEKVFLSNSSTLKATLNADKSKQVRLGVFSSTGQLMLETTRTLSPGMNNLSVEISNLRPGLYFLRVFGEGVDAKARAFSKP